jgi:glc operon protein GlcG
MRNVARLAGRSALLVGAMTVAVGVSEAHAQGTTPVPLAKVIVSDDAAKVTLLKMQINAATARAIVDACVEFANATNSSYSVIVLAPSGDVVDAHIMDGQNPIAVEAATLKAKTALYARSSSAAIMQRFSTTDGRMIRMHLGESTGRAYYFAPGGFPIVVENELIGAIGVGGGPQEEQCAYQALTKVLGPQPPGNTPQPGRGRGPGAPPAGGPPAAGR